MPSVILSRLQGGYSYFSLHTLQYPGICISFASDNPPSDPLAGHLSGMFEITSRLVTSGDFHRHLFSAAFRPLGGYCCSAPSPAPSCSAKAIPGIASQTRNGCWGREDKRWGGGGRGEGSLHPPLSPFPPPLPPSFLPARVVESLACRSNGTVTPRPALHSAVVCVRRGYSARICGDITARA